MPVYQYQAVNRTGKRIKGIHHGSERNDVLKMLRDNMLIPIHIKEVEGKESSKSIELFHFGKKVKLKEIAVLCRQFYTMLKAGITIIVCLDILRHQTEHKYFRKIIGEVYEEVQKGYTFSEALKKYERVFPELLINMVEMGEVSGNLDSIMDSMATYYEKDYKINNKVKSAMVYPTVLAVVSIGVVVFLLAFVMPTFVGMFANSGVDLPLPTRILLSLSKGLTVYWYVVITTVGIIVFSFKRWSQTDGGRMLMDQLKFKIPVIKGVNQKIVTSRFTRTLAILLHSGIPLLYALEIVSKIVGNRYVAEGILSAKEEVRKGMDLATPIKKIGIFPPMIDSMIRVGEESGALDSILMNTALYYDEEVEVALQKLTTMLEPLMIVLMAVLIGAMVIAMILPMFDMMNTIGL